MKGKGYQSVFGPSPTGMIGGVRLLGFIDMSVGAGTRPGVKHHCPAKRAKNKARRQAIKAARRRK